MDNKRYQGKVKFFNDVKGYGFIKLDSGREVFVHATKLKNGIETLESDQNVTFECVDGKKGIEAHHVEII